jgi:hypothetical protein
MLIYTTLYYISEGVENSTLSLFSSVIKIIIYNIIDRVKKLQDYVYLIMGVKGDALSFARVIMLVMLKVVQQPEIVSKRTQTRVTGKATAPPVHWAMP